VVADLFADLLLTISYAYPNFPLKYCRSFTEESRQILSLARMAVLCGHSDKINQNRPQNISGLTVIV